MPSDSPVKSRRTLLEELQVNMSGFSRFSSIPQLGSFEYRLAKLLGSYSIPFPHLPHECNKIALGHVGKPFRTVAQQEYDLGQNLSILHRIQRLQLCIFKRRP